MTHSAAGPRSDVGNSLSSEDGPPERLARGLPERRFRPEIHGLRGLAILGVVVFHLFGQGRVSGGIDVFLAISGFLFTGMLLREAAVSGGRIDLGRYLSRLARRILPPALLVAAVVGGLAWWILPEVRHGQVARELLATVLYYENFELINSQLAYEAAGPLTSPFQHFWSLSVQGQFFLIWPLVAVLAVWLAKRFETTAAVLMARLTVGVLLVSFAYALWMRAYDVDVAYLHTGTRMWELAFGAMLAFVIGGIRLPSGPRWMLGWAGVALLVSCGFVLDGAQAFPGPWALWPLMALVLVMISAEPGEQQPARWSAERWLRTAPMTWVGHLAYGLYLWHWPLLIFYLEWRGIDRIGVAGAAAVLALSLVLAWLTYRWLEVPLQRATRVRWRAVVAGVAAMGLVATGSIAWASDLDQRRQEAIEAAETTGITADYPGATATVPGAEVPPDLEPLPDLTLLPEDEPDYYDWPCRQEQRDGPGTDEVLVCDDPDPPENPTATIVIAGGSHAGQWVPTFRILAEQNNWEILIADKSSCQVSTPMDIHLSSCHGWNENLVDALAEHEPDAIFTIGSTTWSADGDAEHLPEEFIEKWAELGEADLRVIAVRDTPRMPSDIPECLANHGFGDPACARERSEVYADDPPWTGQDIPESVDLIDLLDHVCGPEYCDPVVGNVVVYRDQHHLSTMYAESLAPILDDALRESAPYLYDD